MRATETAIPTRWKKLIIKYIDINENNVYQNHGVVDGARVLSLDKLSFKEIYSILISNSDNKPTSNTYIERLFKNTNLDWSKIYLPPRSAAILHTPSSVVSNIKFLITYYLSAKKYALLE